MTSQDTYDVFISFRGKDTRDGFTSHLYVALCQNKISTYIDDRLQKGSKISYELFRAIEKSKFSIVIFSENYASSCYCLNELEHIMKLKKTIVPVFYHVDPSLVRRHKGSYAAALSKLERRYGKNKVDVWRTVLTEAANRSGFHSTKTSPEAKLVKEVVQDVLEKLKQSLPSDVNLQGFFGLEEQIAQIESLLGPCSKDTRIIALWGMAGIGKTTLAHFMIHCYSSQFEIFCFVENIREESDNHGQNYVRNKLCLKLFNDESLNTTSPFFGPFITTRLCQKKVLIVLDDVSHSRQLEFLGGEVRFGHGTIVIVTTRDKHVLKGITGNEMTIKIHEVQKLGCDDAVHLFQLHAFRSSSPATGYKEISKRVLHYANGNPLALKILGSHLCDRSKKIWESTLNKLEEIPDKDLHKVLQISYDDLDENEKNIFLDLVCFFKGSSINFVKKVLDGCGFFMDVGVELLIEKSLITINDDNKVWMHDMVQQMGRQVADQQSKHRRLWRVDEIYNVLTNDIGTEDIEGIFLDISALARPLHLRRTTFSKMYNLRLLKIYRSYDDTKKFKVHAPPDIKPFSSRLRYLHWEEYPLKTLPLDFPEDLVVLHLPASQIVQLWAKTKTYFNFGTEIIKNMGCSCLFGREEEIMSTISHPQKLVSLDLQNSKALTSLPSSIIAMGSLLYLNLSGCSSLNYEFTHLPRCLTKLNLSETAIEVVSESIEALSNLKLFKLRDCKGLQTLPNNICKLKHLQALRLDGCANLKTFPEIHEPMENLQLLSLAKTGVKELPWQIEYLSGLRELHLEGCKHLVKLPESIKQLRCLGLLYVPYCESLKSLPELPSCPLQLYAHHCSSLQKVPRSTFAMTDDCDPSTETFGFYNCPKLDHNAINNIIADALLRIYREASLARTHTNDEDIMENTMIVEYPGDQFPKWIECQTEGSSLNIILPPRHSRSNLVGIVVCAQVVVNHYFEKVAILRWDYNFPTSNGWSDPLYGYLTFWSTHLDHVFIASYTIRSFCSFLDDIREIKVVFSIYEDGVDVSEYYKVKKCGIKCIYAEEVEEFLANYENVEEPRMKEDT